MQQIKTSYVLATPFWPFMTRALGIRYEYDNAIMRNLIDAERGENCSWLPSKEKQLIQVKKLMSKAFKVYLKMKLEPEAHQQVVNCANELEFATDSSALLNIVQRVLAVTPKEK